MGKTQKAQAAYKPTGQAAADQQYQQLTASAQPWATALPGQVNPGLVQVANNVANNPYASQAQGGANLAYNIATGGYQPGGYTTPSSAAIPGATPMGADTSGGKVAAQGYQPAQLGGVAGTALNASAQLSNAGDNAMAYAPAATGGAQYADGLMQSGIGLANMGVGVGQQAMGVGQNTYDAAMSGLNASATGARAALGGYNTAMQGYGNSQAGYNQIMSYLPSVTGGMDAAQQVLNTGFDPQQALHDRNYQSTMDSQNALNAMYGLGNSAYGAGVAGKTASDFNIDWQNSQLARQVQALGAYGTQEGVVANNVASLGNTGNNFLNTGNSYLNTGNSYLGQGANYLNTGNNFLNTGTNGYMAGVGAMNTGMDNARQALSGGINNYNTAMGGAVDNYTKLVASGQDAYNGATAQGMNAVNTVAQSSQLANAAYLGQQQAQMAGYQGVATGTANALQPTNQLAASDNSYLQTGQSATSISNKAVEQNNAASAAQMGALTQGIGSIAALALAPATGGMSLFALGGMAGAGGAAPGAATSAAISGGYS